MKVSKFNSSKFEPSDELLDFANQFDSDYRNVPVGDYFSSGSNFHIRYLDRIIDRRIERPINTVFRVGNTSRVIEIDKTLLNDPEYTGDFVFFAIIWCVLCRKLNSDYFKTDKVAIDYYKTTGRSLKNLESGYIKLMMSARTPHANKRIEAFEKNVSLLE